MVKKSVILPVIATVVILSAYYYSYSSNIDLSAFNTRKPDIHENKVYRANGTDIQSEINVFTIIPKKEVYTRDIDGTDLGDKINKANKECSNVACRINVNEAGKISSAVYLSDNRILAFDQGMYSISAPIRLGNNNEVHGSNSTDPTILVRDPSWFEGVGADERTSPPADFNSIKDADMFKVVRKQNIIIHDLVIDGNTDDIGYYPLEGVIPKPTGKLYNMPKGKQAEVYLFNSSNILLYNLEIKYVQTHAVSASATSGLVIEDCNFSSDGWNRYQLIWIGQQQNENILIMNNIIHNSSHAGLYLEYTQNALVEGNTFDHNRVNTFYTGPGGQIGLQVHTNNITIRNNTIINAGHTPAEEVPKRNKAILGHGIEVHGANITIIDNLIANNSGFGISLKNNVEFIRLFPGETILPTHDILILGNTIVENGGATGINVPINEEPSVYNITIDENRIDMSEEKVFSLPDE